MVALGYAIRANGGIDKLVISHLDKLREISVDGKIKVCVAYDNIDNEICYKSELRRWAAGDAQIEECDRMTKELFKARPIYQEIKVEDFLDFVEGFWNIKIAIGSFGPTYLDKRED